MAHLIAPFGNIDTIKIVRNKKTKKCKGYAFVEMRTEAGAASAAALKGTSMKGRELTVKISACLHPHINYEKSTQQQTAKKAEKKK